MTHHIISIDAQDPFIQAIANLDEAGLGPITIAEWSVSEREAA
jgi:hypothetical protein